MEKDVSHSYHSQKIDELYAKLKGYKVFSSLDLRSGYYHIGLKVLAKPKISIRLIIPRQVPVEQSPIRTSTSTSIFPETDQRHTERMQLVMGYLDDIIIYSRSEKEHLEHLEEIFIRLRAAGLKT